MLVEYPALPPMEESRIRIAAEPELVLGVGGAPSGPDHDFFLITGVSQLRDGTLVVANQGSSQLRFYGADGEFVRSVGREGDGPGEFRSLWAHWIMAGDTVVVWDRGTRRLQYFSPEGALVRAASMGEAPFAGYLRPVPEAVLENGRVAAFLVAPASPTGGLPERPPLLVALQRINGEGWDSVGVVKGVESINTDYGDGQLAMARHTLGAYAVASGAGATVAVADAARFRVDLFDSNGRLVSVISAIVPEVAATPDVLEAYIERTVELWPGGLPFPDFANNIRTGMRGLPYAPFLPAIRAVLVDADERIWVERYDVPGSGPSRWEVFARDGTWLGRVEMPEGLARGADAHVAPDFSVRSGRLAGVWTDPATGVETVRVYRVIETGS
jgi:hypothetical protein